MSVGAERLLLDSDPLHIISDLGRSIASIQGLDVPAADHRGVSAENARRVFGF